MKTLEKLNSVLNLSSEDVSEDVSPILEKEGYRYILNEAWEENGKLYFELSGDFEMVYSFLDMDNWEPNEHEYPALEKIVINIVINGEKFQINSIRVDGEDFIQGNIDVNYSLKMLEGYIEAINNEAMNEAMVELTMSDAAYLFHDQEWWWTRDAENRVHSICGRIDTPELGVESDIWVHVDSLDMDEDYIHGDPYRGKITI